MIKTIKVTLFLFAVLIFSNASAHFLWIETAGDWKLNTPGKIDIYYGEYNNRQLEKVDGRFSEVEGFKVWITIPVYGKRPLEFVPAGDHYTTSFTPSVIGIYTIELENVDRGVVDWTAYDIGIIKPNYYASAKFKVAAPANYVKPLMPDLAPMEITTHKDLVITPADTNRNKLNQPLRFSMQSHGKPLPHQKLMVHAANGWSKELEPDASGDFYFIPVWEGQYVMEAIYSQKIPGIFEGKDYQAIRHRATYTFKVKKQ